MTAMPCCTQSKYAGVCAATDSGESALSSARVMQHPGAADAWPVPNTQRARLRCTVLRFAAATRTPAYKLPSRVLPKCLLRSSNSLLHPCLACAPASWHWKTKHIVVTKHTDSFTQTAEFFGAPPPVSERCNNKSLHKVHSCGPAPPSRPENMRCPSHLVI